MLLPQNVITRGVRNVMVTRRRQFLKTALAISAVGNVAGCLGNRTDDLHIRNKSGTQQTISIHVVRLSNNNELLDETITLVDGETKEYAEVAGEYTCRVSVNVQNGPSNKTEWADSGIDSYTLGISIEESTINFQESAV